MTAIPSSSLAAQAYRAMQSAGDAAGATVAGSGVAGGAAGSDFGQALSSALQGAVAQGGAAEAQARAAIAGQGNLLDVVTAISRAELSLQTTIAVRDRVVQSYQDIMHMAI